MNWKWEAHRRKLMRMRGNVNATRHWPIGVHADEVKEENDADFECFPSFI